LRKKNKEKPRLPTEEEFLTYRPQRGNFQWSEDSEGLVKIKVPKFTSNFGISFCNLLKKENEFTASMDKYGSLVWKNCNGKKTVKQILVLMEKNFPDEKEINQRLYLFLQQMQSLGYIYF
jgi:hypothetical protein